MKEGQMVEKQKLEIKRLNRFSAHLSVLKTSVGLPDDTIDTLRTKIDSRISACELYLREIQRSNNQ